MSEHNAENPNVQQATRPPASGLRQLNLRLLTEPERPATSQEFYCRVKLADATGLVA